jgi:hypothetical protein
VALGGDHDQRLTSRAAAPVARLEAADQGLIDLDRAGQLVTTGKHHRPPELVQPRPRRLIATEAEHAL